LHFRAGGYDPLWHKSGAAVLPGPDRADLCAIPACFQIHFGNLINSVQRLVPWTPAFAGVTI
jgi:hypothetical protein